MKRHQTLRRSLAAALAVFGLAHIPAHQAAAQGVTDKTIKIGAYNALTGPSPLTGKQMATGWQAAVKAINDGGGIHGRKLELVMEDDGYEPSRALAAARKLVEHLSTLNGALGFAQGSAWLTEIWPPLAKLVSAAGEAWRSMTVTSWPSWLR